MSTKGRELGQLRMYILDVLRHDKIENIDSILKLLNNSGCIGWREFWPDDFTDNEVLPQLRILATEGQIKAMCDNEQGDELELISANEIVASEPIWFALTDAGKEAWDAWKPPTTDEHSNQ